MPIISTIGGATAKGFGFSSGSNPPVSFDYLVVAGGDLAVKLLVVSEEPAGSELLFQVNKT